MCSTLVPNVVNNDRTMNIKSIRVNINKIAFLSSFPKCLLSSRISASYKIIKKLKNKKLIKNVGKGRSTKYVLL